MTYGYHNKFRRTLGLDAEGNEVLEPDEAEQAGELSPAPEPPAPVVPPASAPDAGTETEQEADQ